MLRERALYGLVLGLPVMGLVIAGGWWMTVLVVIVGSIALIEFAQLVARRGHRAFGGLMLLWMLLFAADRQFPAVDLLAPGMALLLLITMAWALIRYRQGALNAITGFAMTVGGALYVGWPAAHFISLRRLGAGNDGLFWTLTVVFAIWSADSMAYLAGRAFGKHKLIRDISPGKTWEGYLASIAFSIVFTGLLPLGWQALGATDAVSPVAGMTIGGLVATLAPMGDLAISMLKRYAAADDSSNLIPGHGGFLDRVDTLIVACLLGYYYLILFIL